MLQNANRANIRFVTNSTDKKDTAVLRSDSIKVWLLLYNNYRIQLKNKDSGKTVIISAYAESNDLVFKAKKLFLTSRETVPLSLSKEGLQ